MPGVVFRRVVFFVDRFPILIQNLRMTRNRCLLAALCLLGASLVIFAAPPAHAIGFTLYGASNISQLTVTSSAGTVKSSSELTFGGGASVIYPWTSWLHFDFGALYLGRKYGSAGRTNSLSMIELPVLARLWLGSYFTLGFGPYFSLGLGNVNHSAMGSISFSDAGLKSTDIGGVLDVGILFPLFSSASLLLEGRYTSSLLNVAVESDLTRKFNDIQALIGITFGVHNSSAYSL